jgi:acyl carrier protein
MSVTVTPRQVEDRVVAALIEFGADPDLVGREARWDALHVDSLDLVELIQVVEDDYGIRLTGEDIKGLPTVGSVIDLVASRLES